MRFQAIFAAMLVLLTGTLRFCPACEFTSEAPSSISAESHGSGSHGCCEKATDAASTPDSVPVDGHAPGNSGCVREHVTFILQSASLDVSSAMDTVAVLATVVPSTEPLFEQAFAADAPMMANPSPPPLLSTPIRI